MTEAWRGLQVSSLSAEQREQLDLLPETTGVFVLEVEPDSLADQAGLRHGDLINEINRVRIESVNDYRAAVAQVKGNAALVRTSRGYFVIKKQ